MNSLKFFGLWRKSMLLCPVEDFFELNSRATKEKKDQNRVQKRKFLAN
jgi:hypothetical protein